MKKILFVGLLIAAIAGTTPLAEANCRRGYACEGCVNPQYKEQIMGTCFRVTTDIQKALEYLHLSEGIHYCLCNNPPATGEKCKCQNGNAGEFVTNGTYYGCACTPEEKECHRLAYDHWCDSLKAKNCLRFQSIKDRLNAGTSCLWLLQ